MSGMISMNGAIDLHLHSFPSLFPRLGDDVDIAMHARSLGLRGLMIKCHHESTSSRAYLLRKLVPDIEICGGIVLNTYVGGFNPAAVEACLKLEGKGVWMPSVDAWHHGVVYGRTGSFELHGGGRSAGEGLKVLDESGRLWPEVYEILDLIAQYDVILGTSHLSPPEILVLVREARNRGVRKVTITHPFFKAPNLDLETLQALVKLGAVAEFGYCTVSPHWAYATVRQIKQAIDLIGPANAVLTSGTGQRYNPLPAEALRIFAQELCEVGIREDDIYTMIVRNPADLLGLPAYGSASGIRPFPTGV